VTSIQEKIHTPSDSVMKQMMISGILVSFDKYETSLFHRKKKEKKGEQRALENANGPISPIKIFWVRCILMIGSLSTQCF